MDRPKKEDYMLQYSFSYGSWEEPDGEAYQQALNNYIDQLEKALDKACEMLEDFDLETHHEDDELFNKVDWKEWCMEDD